MITNFVPYLFSCEYISLLQAVLQALLVGATFF